MSEEYQRLQDAARDVEREMAELENIHRVNSAVELAAIERRLDLLSVAKRCQHQIRHFAQTVLATFSGL